MTGFFPVAASLLVAAGPLPQRFAVLVGANEAAPGRQRLRFAHRDAEDMAEVLIRTGEFPPAHVQLLLDPDPDAVLQALDSDLSEAARAPQGALLLFYYSGHADLESLFPNGKALSLARLRERLENPAATVRVGIVDACRGGGWTRAKGVTREEPLEIRPPLELSSEGSALLASSSGLESAHESESLIGSFFTHHLVAGLRGAADRDGDGEVTLAEAFAYARELTVRDSSLQAETQHPSFLMNLRGRSDLPMARVAASNTLVELRQSEGPLQVIQLTTGLTMLELPQGKRAVRVAVPPGRYLVRSKGTEGVRAREIAVEADRAVAVEVEEASLELVGSPYLALKAGGLPGARLRPVPPATGSSPRAELVTFSTMEGFAAGALLAGAAETSSKGATALLMTGTGLGLALSLGLSSGRDIPQSMPPMMELGASYGIMATLVGFDLAHDLQGKNIAGPIAGAMVGGSVLGAIAAPSLTGGDAAAATSGFLYAGTLPLLFEAAVNPHAPSKLYDWSLLIGGTVGIPLGVLANRQLGWSRARWNVISLGGGVGALLGAGTAILADAWNGDGRTGFLLTGLGALGGLALTAFLTSDFGVDEPRGLALLHVEPGRQLSLGQVSAAVAPLRTAEGRTGALLKLLDGRF